MKYRPVVIVLLLAFIPIFSILPAEAGQREEKAALQAADSFLALVDNGRYAESWEAAASLFRNAVSKSQWTAQLQAIRPALGANTGRSVKSSQYATTLPGAPDGQYVVIQYQSSFSNKRTAIETVTPMLDTDGKWRVSGYYIK